MPVASPLPLFLLLAGLHAGGVLAAQTDGPGGPRPDRRTELRGGFADAAETVEGMKLLVHVPRPAGFGDSAAADRFPFLNTDFAFRGTLLFQGNFLGIQVWDIADPRKPRLRSTIPCPGGQADPSVYGNLLFVSVEQANSRVDCGAQGVSDTVSAERFRGVRIFDISDLDRPRQVAAIQTCRGSHTHTLVPDPADSTHVYVYVSEVSVVRPGAELPGCSSLPPSEDPQTSRFLIDVIEVPLASPQDARIVSSPRIFADSAGNIAGLWSGGSHGEGSQETAETDQCHDITIFPAARLAAGACSGNGILLDLTDPANPVRIHEVTDPNFAYFHSATFNNEATAVVFTDEWGGGSQPRCRATDPAKWGANAIFTIAEGRMTAAGFYKLPAAQGDLENCVAHNGSLIPVPGRDIMVQGWYQGGVSVLDFTDPARPIEIGYFDRGAVDTTKLVMAGHWAAYWYNGVIVASEIRRGLDLLELVPSAYLSRNEIDAARSVRLEVFNPQVQPRLTWPPSFVLARAYLDQLRRSGGLTTTRIAAAEAALRRAEKQSGARQRKTLSLLAAELEHEVAGARDAARVRALASAVERLAGAVS